MMNPTINCSTRMNTTPQSAENILAFCYYHGFLQLSSQRLPWFFYWQADTMIILGPLSIVLKQILVSTTHINYSFIDYEVSLLITYKSDTKSDIVSIQTNQFSGSPIFENGDEFLPKMTLKAWSISVILGLKLIRHGMSWLIVCIALPHWGISWLTYTDSPLFLYYRGRGRKFLGWRLQKVLGS